MDYFRHYNLLIAKAWVRVIEPGIYTEKHHIIPKSIGGNNNKNNIITLYPREHLMAHLLLVKIFPASKELLYAANMMTNSNGNNLQKRNNTKTYEWLKKKFSLLRKESMKGSNNHRFGKSMSDETKAKISNAKKGKISPKRGITSTQETKLKISTTRINNKLAKGENNPMFGKKHKDISKIKMSQNRKGKGLAESNGMFGKTHTDEVKQSLREKNLKTWKITHITTGDIWIGTDIDVFCKDHGLVKGSMQDVARARKKNPLFNHTYKKQWICEFYEEITDHLSNCLNIKQNKEKIMDYEEIMKEITEEVEINFEEKYNETRDLYLRTLADVENTKKRLQKEKDNMVKFANENFAKGLIEIYDNIELALNNFKDKESQEYKGIEIINKSITKLFENNNIKEVDYSVFNPYYHEVISTIDSDKDKDSIISILRKGFTINERLLRAALVTTAKGQE